MKKFELGEVVITRSIAESLEKLGKEKIIEIINMHSNGSWGVLSEYDKQLNNEAVKTGEGRILSKYTINNESIYIITETDRSVTTILFANEY